MHIGLENRVSFARNPLLQSAQNRSQLVLQGNQMCEPNAPHAALLHVNCTASSSHRSKLLKGPSWTCGHSYKDYTTQQTHLEVRPDNKNV